MPQRALDAIAAYLAPAPQAPGPTAMMSPDQLAMLQQLVEGQQRLQGLQSLPPEALQEQGAWDWLQRGMRPASVGYSTGGIRG